MRAYNQNFLRNNGTAVFLNYLIGENEMKKLLGLTLLLFFIAGCSTIAPRYNTDFNNISQMRKEKLNPVKIGSVTKDPTAQEDVEYLTVRGGRYVSPNGTFTAYIEEALKQELEDARLLDPNSQIELSGVLLKNMLDGSGTSIGIAEIEVRFVVRKSGDVKYDKIKKARHTWESAFAGMIAVPKAHQNYPIVVQKLLGSLFSDPEFISVLR